MKLLDLFSAGTTGTAGTSVQGQGFPPSRCTGTEKGQRDGNTGTGLPATSSRPVRPGPDCTNGTGESVAALSSSRSSRSSRSETEQHITEHPDNPTPAQLGHALRMRAACKVQGRNLHCWHCSRCPKAGTCKAWLPRRADVEFFRGSEKPYSLILMEERGEEERGEKGREEDKGTGQGTPSVSDYAAFCSSYWRGCRVCPDYVAGQLRFCGRYNRTIGEAAQVLQ